MRFGPIGNDGWVSCIAILHPGQMGAEVGRVLVEAGHDVGWLPAGRGPGTRRRADEAGLNEIEDLRDREIVLSVCPPAAAVDTARHAHGFRGLYVDANAISPSRAAEVSSVVQDEGADYVDAGIVGPPPHRSGTTRLYLSGPYADRIASVFEGTRIESVVIPGSATAASALKMTYAAWTKITSALLVSISEVAERLGVTDELARECALSQPDLADRHAHAASAAHAKGWRWSAEMSEVARAFAEAGQPAGFAVAAAELFARLPRPPDD